MVLDADAAPVGFCTRTEADDGSDARLPKAIAAFVPRAPPLSRANSIRLDDVVIAERGIVDTVDRFSGGIHVVEMDI